ncbi:hypothetical protein J2X31_003492 [Flavobacterium arsenatis]|uniref:Uncharacterized protein n=1 Tax=Flavobacterium arsenatis TaxID=1484332 RepID=A0ABU1TUC0_9FLAO|nr:hypothetical protein [Flavobacterium arsenatis]MDR6969461.1 hypothetical protein [Flavobacterium arsenatis]
MNIQEQTSKIAYQAYRNIDFVRKLKNNSLRYDFPLDNIMKKMDKKENLKILKELGCDFKIFTPGQHYNYEEVFGNIKLILSCQISGGIITDYIYIYVDGNKIDGTLLKSNLGFVYRYLLNDKEAEIKASKFRNFDDFRNAMGDILSIYEDFKTEFLKLMKEENLIKN